MYHAKVMVASKVRKNDLPVKSGDTVSIIRTTNCPKGKWLARDANHKCEFRHVSLSCDHWPKNILIYIDFRLLGYFIRFDVKLQNKITRKQKKKNHISSYGRYIRPFSHEPSVISLLKSVTSPLWLLQTVTFQL